ncbi:MAG: iron ABC transporter permease [Burkholderiales bacterium]|nr:iron ABC transporter permease [Anaerolineae bacterium]
MAQTVLSTAQERRSVTSIVPRLRVRRWPFAILLVLLVGVFFLSLILGSVNIPLDNVVRVLLGGEADRASWNTIVMNVRLPRALTAILAGAALAVSGLQMQTLFRNPLADPFVLGISSGASVGVALVVLAATGTVGAALVSGLGIFGQFSVAIAASLGAGAVMAMVLLVARKVQSPVTLLIVGLMFGYATSAIVSLMLYFSIAERIQAYIMWTFGSFGGVTWGQLIVLAPIILAALALAMVLAKTLNALLLGEAYARTMGVNVWQARLWIIISSALLAGTITAFCGPIGFLGVAVPHLCRSLFNTSDHRTLIPAVTLMGAVIALIADLIAQVPGSQTVLPLNAVMALVGAPVVMWVILRRRHLRAAFAA